MRKGHIQLSVYALTLAIALTGCRMQGPNWTNPGTVQQQRDRAEGKGQLAFDPFYDNSIGTPIPDARPRDFGSPRDETPLSRGVISMGLAR